jgi:hypothetical protein
VNVGLGYLEQMVHKISVLSEEMCSAGRQMDPAMKKQRDTKERYVEEDSTGTMREWGRAFEKSLNVCGGAACRWSEKENGCRKCQAQIRPLLQRSAAQCFQAGIITIPSPSPSLQTLLQTLQQPW